MKGVGNATKHIRQALAILQNAKKKASKGWENSTGKKAEAFEHKEYVIEEAMDYLWSALYEIKG